MTDRYVVVGAAPIGGVRVVGDTEKVVAVNGGISSTADFVDVWVVNSRDKQLESWGPAFRHLNSLMLQQGAGRAVGKVVLLTKGGERDAEVTLQLLRAQGTQFFSHIEIAQTERTRIERVTGARIPSMSKHALSAGMFAVCMCFESGASHVRMRGFSWHPGYAYTNDPHVTKRGHAHGDREALRRLCAIYGDRLTSFDPEIAAMAKRAPRLIHPPLPREVTVNQTPLRVRATTLLIYNNARRRPGDIFTLASASDFRPRQMERLSMDVAESASTVAMARRMEHASIIRGKTPQLQPNGVDLLDGEQTDTDDNPLHV